jgi:hypothetical protein
VSNIKKNTFTFPILTCFLGLEIINFGCGNGTNKRNLVRGEEKGTRGFNTS